MVHEENIFEVERRKSNFQKHKKSI